MEYRDKHFWVFLSILSYRTVPSPKVCSWPTIHNGTAIFWDFPTSSVPSCTSFVPVTWSVLYIRCLANLIINLTRCVTKWYILPFFKFPCWVRYLHFNWMFQCQTWSLTLSWGYLGQILHPRTFQRVLWSVIKSCAVISWGLYALLTLLSAAGTHLLISC